MPSPPQMPLFRGVVEAVEDGRPPVADERPHRLPSVTRRLELPYGTSDLVIDVTISYRDERPFEVFFNCAHLGDVRVPGRGVAAREPHAQKRLPGAGRGPGP